MSRYPVLLFYADAIQLASTMPLDSVKVCPIDGPYGMGYRSNRRKQRKGIIAGDTPNAALALHIGLYDQLREVLVKGGSWFVWTQLAARDCTEVIAPLWNLPFNPGLEYAGFVTWNKGSIKLGSSWRRQTEQALHFYRPLVKGRSSTGILMTKDMPDIITEPAVRSTEETHSAEKPVNVIYHLLKSTADPGDLVFDPFCGYGVSLEVAGRMGCRVIGGDCDPVAVLRTARRLEKTNIPYRLCTIHDGKPVEITEHWLASVTEEDPHPPFETSDPLPVSFPDPELIWRESYSSDRSGTWFLRTQEMVLHQREYSVQADSFLDAWEQVFHMQVPAKTDVASEGRSRPPAVYQAVRMEDYKK